MDLGEVKELLKNQDTQSELVFLAACHSEPFGEAFVEVGVPHVVCVNEMLTVIDDVAIKMTKEFYKEILSGAKICDAYYKARTGAKFALENKIDFCRSEVERIKLLTPQGLRGRMGLHTCKSLPIACKGQWECISQHNLAKDIPTKRGHKYRESEISKVLQLLLIKDSPETGARPRFFSLEGYRGMGKSSLALSIMHYTAERKMFLGGLMLV